MISISQEPLDKLPLGQLPYPETSEDDNSLQKEQIPSETTLFDLPNELLTKIVKKFSPSQFLKLQLVCKQFYDFKEPYFKWIAKVWNITGEESNITGEKSIMPVIIKLYEQIINASIEETDEQSPIKQVDFTTPVPAMIRKYQEHKQWLHQKHIYDVIGNLSQLKTLQANNQLMSIPHSLSYNSFT